MTTGQASLNPREVPRTLEGLLAIKSPFKLRVLAMNIGALGSTEQMHAWHSLPSEEERAKYLLTCLLEWDKANPVAGAPATPATNGAANGVAHPVTPATSAAVAGPPAVPAGAAAAAAAATAEKPKRTPRTSTTAEAPAADLGVDVVNLLTEIKTAVAASAAEQKDLHKQFGEIVTGNAASYAEIDGKLDTLAEGLQALSKRQGVMMGLLLIFLQEHTGGSMADLLGAAAGDAGQIEDVLANLGKA